MAMAERCEALPRVHLPVRNTFIDFSIPPPADLLRHRTCPPSFAPSCTCFGKHHEAQSTSGGSSASSRKENLSPAPSASSPSSNFRGGHGPGQQGNRDGLEVSTELKKALGSPHPSPALRVRDPRGLCPPPYIPSLGQSGLGHIEQMSERETSRRALSRCLRVGIKNDAGFGVAQRLIGKGGENMKYISENSDGATVRVCGSLQRHSQQEVAGDLEVRVYAWTQASLEKATVLVEELLEKVQEDHKDFCSRLQKPTPELFVQCELDGVESEGRGCRTTSEDEGWSLVKRRREKEHRCEEPPMSQVKTSCRFRVGIEDDQAFRVVRRLIGPSGQHIKSITEGSHGAKVWVCGRGVQTRDPSEAEEPLTIKACASSTDSLDQAAALIKQLLERVHQDYYKFCLAIGKALPVLSVQQEDLRRT
eukprot:CAMPEP_0170604146 /NCGR_PEP_ID=MMETSP0224-20130122/19271_1 /TAXON_ID=285029 /ORGANISM="Togula jolla, Strain CCCM 725" /LENGTH=419 /DNA_ID=CAMNT_0010929037 /DNA_START=44 /DNA_END=1303 /DNA_ORIENTATION=+